MSLYLVNTAAGKLGIPLPQGTIINDGFNNGNLATGKWTVASGLTISTDGNYMSVLATAGAKNATKIMKYTGWGKSTLRNYTSEISFKLNALVGGFGIGPDSSNNGLFNSFVFSAAAMVDLDNSKLEIRFPDINGTFAAANNSVTLGALAINITDKYTLKLSVFDQTATARITNLTTSGYVETIYTYISNTPTNPNRPNIFEYSQFFWGSADVRMYYFRVLTTERDRPDIAFFVDSIGTGYCATLFTLGYGSLIQSHTSGLVQIMGGGGNTIDSVEKNLTEINRVIPRAGILCMGANAFGDINNYIKVFNSLQNSGTDMYCVAAVSGGDPFGVSTLNSQFRIAFGAKFRDTWSGSNGWNVFAANGWLVDSVHPNNTGHTQMSLKTASVIPELFPL